MVIFFVVVVLIFLFCFALFFQYLKEYLTIFWWNLSWFEAAFSTACRHLCQLSKSWLLVWICTDIEKRQIGKTHFSPWWTGTYLGCKKITILTVKQPRVSHSYVLLEIAFVLWDSLMSLLLFSQQGAISSNKDWENMAYQWLIHTCALRRLHDYC